MWKNFHGPLPVLLTIAALAFAQGCIFDPKPSNQPPVRPEINWPDMTDRNDVIRTLVLCYTYPKQAVSMEKYRGLLHSEYNWYFHEEDVDPDKDPILTYSQEIEVTELIFDNQSLLELSIPVEGPWVERQDIDGDPCENCWETTRTYYIRAQFGPETMIYVSPPERAFVTIVIAPNESDPSKWVIRAMYDLGI